MRAAPTEERISIRLPMEVLKKCGGQLLLLRRAHGQLS